MNNLQQIVYFAGFSCSIWEENSSVEEFSSKVPGKPLFAFGEIVKIDIKVYKTRLPELMSKINVLFWLKSPCSHFLCIFLYFFSPNFRVLARFLDIFSTELKWKYFYLGLQIPDLLAPKKSHFAALFRHYVLKSQIWSFIFGQRSKMTFFGHFWNGLRFLSIFQNRWISRFYGHLGYIKFKFNLNFL